MDEKNHFEHIVSEGLGLTGILQKPPAVFQGQFINDINHTADAGFRFNHARGVHILKFFHLYPDET